MSDKNWPLSFEIDIHGACVVAEKERLHPACASDGEIDHHINDLKQKLDRLANPMKKALEEQRKEPLFDD